ncbi:MAG: lasso peptide biosynthesis B2 protein [Hydrogenophaga sp.]|nr:lasso peptide biosynthesis B2 protein [Hydrogenophaga sp.]
MSAMPQTSPPTSTPPGRLAQFRALSAAQQRTLLAASVYLPLCWLGLRFMGLPRLQAWLQRRPLVAATPAPALALADIQALGEAVNIAARHTPFHATCLTRSLLLGWLLRRRGVASELRIGVRLTQGTLDAHAWVECGGVPVNDRPDIATQFAPFGDLVPLDAFQS